MPVLVIDETTIRDHIDFLTNTSRTLRDWAQQSRQGGWSTHQVEANLALARKCDIQEIELRRLLDQRLAS